MMNIINVITALKLLIQPLSLEVVVVSVQASSLSLSTTGSEVKQHDAPKENSDSADAEA